MTRRFSKLALALATSVIVGASAGFASEPVQQHNSNMLWFENWNGLSNATLKVVSPNGKITELYTDTGTPVFQLEGRDILDGVYSYELSAATAEKEKIVNQIDNGRGDAASDMISKPYHAWGSFVVERGVIITPTDVKEDG